MTSPVTSVRRLLAAAGLSLVLTVSAGCTGSGIDVPGPAGSSDLPAPVEEPAYARYVALGDSFTAGPFVPTTDVANGCFRSDGNYPSLVAERLDVDELVDVSCSGASTPDLTAPQPTVRDATVPSQLRALTEDTDLVTLGIGGNDFNVFGTLLETCTRLGEQDPQGSPCSDYLDRRGIDPTAQTDRIADRVAAALAEVQSRAPDARVLLVGYPRIAPVTGTCRNRLPFAAGDYRQGGRIAGSLNDALREAARVARVEFVDVYAASRGHDVCSEEPWVNGQTTDRSAALAFHPLPAGMEAVADLVVAALRDR